MINLVATQRSLLAHTPAFIEYLKHIVTHL